MSHLAEGQERLNESQKLLAILVRTFAFSHARQHHANERQSTQTCKNDVSKDCLQKSRVSVNRVGHMKV